MRKRIAQYGYGAGLAFALFLGSAGISAIFAQDDPVLHYRVDNNTQRITAIESLNMDRRMALVEHAIGEVEKNSTFTGVNMLGIAGLIAERVIQAMRKKNAEPKD